MVDASKDQYLNFGLDGGRLITLDRKDAEDQGPNILRVHAIAADRWACLIILENVKVYSSVVLWFVLQQQPCNLCVLFALCDSYWLLLTRAHGALGSGLMI